MFQKVAELGKADGWVNLARVYIREGRIPDALNALEKAADHRPKPAAPWVINWLTGQVNERNGMLDEAIASYEAGAGHQDPRSRSSTSASITRSSTPWANAAYGPRAASSPCAAPRGELFLRKTIATYRRTLAIDSENVAAHYGLGLAYADPTWKVDLTADLAASGRAGTARRDAIEEEIQVRVERVTDPTITPADPGLEVPGAVGNRSERLMRGSGPRSGSRLEPLLFVVDQARPIVGLRDRPDRPGRPGADAGAGAQDLARAVQAR